MEIKFDRLKPLSDEANGIIARIAKKAAVDEMRAMCLAMLEHNDFDVAHYRLRTFDTSDYENNRFSMVFDVRYYGGNNDSGQ